MVARIRGLGCLVIESSACKRHPVAQLSTSCTQQQLPQLCRFVHIINRAVCGMYSRTLDLTTVRACVSSPAQALLSSAELSTENLMMLTQPVVIGAESDDAGRYWCPEAGCSKSFADRSKQNFKGFRKYENAYYHYEQERKKSNGHAGLYCKSASHRETKRRLLARMCESSKRPEQHSSTAPNAISSEPDLSPLVLQVCFEVSAMRFQFSDLIFAC